MSQELVRSVEKKLLKKAVPDIRPGFTVRVHQKIKEGEKERIQIFEGLVIGVGSGSGMGKTITVRKVVDGIGVEKVFAIHSNTVSKIEIKKASKVRRAKLYYMRGLLGRAARLRDTEVKMHEQALEKEMEQSAAELAEQKAAEEKEKAETE